MTSSKKVLVNGMSSKFGFHIIPRIYVTIYRRKVFFVRINKILYETRTIENYYY